MCSYMYWKGKLCLQLDNGPADTFKAGDSFYEPTNGLHAITKNPSDSETAKILVTMIMEEGAPSPYASRTLN